MSAALSLAPFDALPADCRLDPTEARCCRPGDTFFEGTPAADQISTGSSAQCVLGRGGDDQISTGSADDTVVTSDGDDVVSVGSGHDRVEGGAGHDLLQLGSGDELAFGGPGDDTLDGGSGHDALDGGPGDDVLNGGSGDDLLVPGPGLDEVHAGSGDDLIVIGDACEIESGEIIDGGSGNDTLRSPLSLSELAALGVTVTSIEDLELTDPAPHACDPDPDAWATESSSAIRFRRVTALERAANDWPPGSFVLEWTLGADPQQQGPVAIPTGPESAVASEVGLAFEESGILVGSTRGPEDNPPASEPTFNFFAGSLDGEPSVSLVRGEGVEFAGRMGTCDGAFEARPLGANELLAPSLPPVGPSTLLTPTSNPPIDVLTADPTRIGLDIDIDRSYRVGLIADGGFARERTSVQAATTELYFRLITLRSDIYLATLPVDTNTTGAAAVPTIGLFGSFLYVFDYEPTQCTRILDFGYGTQQEGTNANDPNRLPLTSEGIPRIDIDVDGLRLPDECLLPTGHLYPFADCGFPGINNCMRDRGFSAYQELLNYPVDPEDPLLPLAANRVPDLIQVYTTAKDALAPPVDPIEALPVDRRFEQGMYGRLGADPTEPVPPNSCGIAFQLGGIFEFQGDDINGRTNLPWTPITGADHCHRCAPMPADWPDFDDRRGLSSVAAPAPSNAEPPENGNCEDIVAAHEVGHNFGADHTNLSFSPVPDFDALPAPGLPEPKGCDATSVLSIMHDGPSLNYLCMIQFFTRGDTGPGAGEGEGENNRLNISECIDECRCNPRREPGATIEEQCGPEAP